MCDPRKEAEAVFYRVGGRDVEDYFPPNFIDTFPPSAVVPEYCLAACGRRLSYEEMHPAGRMPRYMCDYCYQQIALSKLKFQCLTCGGQLPQQKIQSQREQPRELRHALHDGPCSDYHWMLAGIVLGVPFRRRAAALPPATQGNILADFLPSRQRLFQPVEVRRIQAPRLVKFLRWPE